MTRRKVAFGQIQKRDDRIAHTATEISGGWTTRWPTERESGLGDFEFREGFGYVRAGLVSESLARHRARS